MVGIGVVAVVVVVVAVLVVVGGDGCCGCCFGKKQNQKHVTRNIICQ